MQITDIFEELRDKSLCKSGHDFSQNYLGKHHSYLSVIKSRKQSPSLEAWAMLSYNLGSKAQIFSGSENVFLQQAAAQLNRLKQAAEDNIMRECAKSAKGR